MLARIIVRLPNWLGDTVMAMPALHALRAALPESRLLLAGSWASLLANQGLADVLRVYPRSWSGRVGAVDGIREFGGDTAVLLPNSIEAALAALYWGAARRVGFSALGRHLLLTDPVAMPAPRLHQVDEYLMLIERLGLPAASRVPRLRPPDAGSGERRDARELLREAGAAEGGAGGARVGVHLGAAYGPSKRWSRARIVELCRLVRGDGDVPVLLGAADDLGVAEEILRSTRAVSVVGRDRPDLLPALLSELDGLVCGDTGVAHLAAALGTPVVTLFGPTDPRLTAPRGPVRIVTRSVPCAPCFYRRCPIDHPCMQGISAEIVRDHLRALLTESRWTAADR